MTDKEILDVLNSTDIDIPYVETPELSIIKKHIVSMAHGHPDQEYFHGISSQFSDTGSPEGECCEAAACSGTCDTF